MLKTDTRQANWRRANPGKYDAHLAVQRAVKAGELEKQTCEVCGVEAVDAHHDQRGFTITAKTCFRSGMHFSGLITVVCICNWDVTTQSSFDNNIRKPAKLYL